MKEGETQGVKKDKKEKKEKKDKKEKKHKKEKRSSTAEPIESSNEVQSYDHAATTLAVHINEERVNGVPTASETVENNKVEQAADVKRKKSKAKKAKSDNTSSFEKAQSKLAAIEANKEGGIHRESSHSIKKTQNHDNQDVENRTTAVDNNEAAVATQKSESSKKEKNEKAAKKEISTVTGKERKKRSILDDAQTIKRKGEKKRKNEKTDKPEKPKKLKVAAAPEDQKPSPEKYVDGKLFSEFQADVATGANLRSTPTQAHDHELWKLAKKKKTSEVKAEAIGESVTHLYPHRVKIYAENADPRTKFKSRVIGLPHHPDFSISDSDSDSDSDSEGTGPLNELHKVCLGIPPKEVEALRKKGIPVKTGKWDVVENKILEKRLKKVARRNKKSFEDIQNEVFSEPFGKNKEFWWSLARAFPQRSMHNIFYHTRRVFDENNYRGQWDAESDAKLMSLIDEHGTAWAKISRFMDRLPNSCLGRYRLLVNAGKGKQNKGVWSQEETDLLIRTVKKYKTEMHITEDKDISWVYVANIFENKRNPLQLRYKWHIISPYVSEDKVVKPEFKHEDRQIIKRDLVNKLRAGDWEHETQIPWASFRDEHYTLDSEASRKLYYRMRNNVPGFESMTLPEIIDKLLEQHDGFVTHDPARPYLTARV